MTGDTDFDVQLGAAIRDARLDAGYTQEELAKVLRLTPATISRYELGIRRVSVNTLLQIANALDHPLSRLIPGADRLKPDHTSEPDSPLRQAVRTVVQVMEQRPDLAPKVLEIIETSLAGEQGQVDDTYEWS